MRSLIAWDVGGSPGGDAMWRDVERIEEVTSPPKGAESIFASGGPFCSVRLDCGHTYIFQRYEPASTNERYGPHVGGQVDCIWCDAMLARTAKRLSGHYLSGRSVDERTCRLR